MSIYEAWNSDTGIIRSGANAVIGYWSFNQESADVDGVWHAQGIVMAGSGDLGIMPVAIRLWAKNPVRLEQDWSKARSETSGRAIAYFVPRNLSCKEESACPGQILQFSETDDGQVYVNDRKIGTVK